MTGIINVVEKRKIWYFGLARKFNSTLNFTQSGWLILFIPDLHFRLANQVSCQTHSLWLETPTSEHVPLQHVFRQNAKKHNPSHVQRHTLPFSTSHNSISSQYSQPLTSLAAPKANTIFHATNKNLFIKTHFDLCHLTSSSFYLYLPLNLSEGTNNTERGNNST